MAASIRIADATGHAPPSAHEIVVAMEDRMNKTAERIDSHAKMIHRFPRGLRGIGGEEDCYVVPSVVAIGPYHRALPHLQDMEEIKHAAARHFCTTAGHSTEDVYKRILSVADDARRCYTSDAAFVPPLEEFAAMMFLDGCFLLEYMVDSNSPVFAGCTLSSGPAILKDMMLLENQIPWLVLETLAALRSVDDVRGFIAGMGEKFFPKKSVPHWKCRRTPAEKPKADAENTVSYEDYRPPHLLGLLRFSQIHSMPVHEYGYRAGSSSLLSSNAVELAQIGVKLTPSTATWFGDTSVKRNLVLGELSLSPLFLNDVTACWLVNMAALEASTAASWDKDDFFVRSYLSMVSMLMDREEDVHQLRGKGVLRSFFSNTQTLAFFKDLGRHLRLGGRYVVVLEQIEAYKRNRAPIIAVHSFLYKNSKIIATVLSIAGLIIGIFKALLALKTD
jgi:hypothetical protein